MCGTGMVNVFGGYHAVRNILLALFVYNLTCTLFFSMMYSVVGFDKHFVMPEGTKPDYANALYYSFAVQATCMAGEIYPKTPLGRGILSFQILSAYLTTMVLIVPWIKATRGH